MAKNGSHVIHYTHLETQIGRLLIAWTGSNLTGLYFENHRGGPSPAVIASVPMIGDGSRSRKSPLVRDLGRQLGEYFCGKRKSFDVPFHPHGTPFQMKVWQTLRDIPYGEVVTYSELARHIGNPAAVRAAGTATGRNPISILIPCHRVVGAHGHLTGYAGGLEMKRRLLSIETATDGN